MCYNYIGDKMKDNKTKYLIVGSLILVFILVLLISKIGKGEEMGLFGNKESYLSGLHHVQIDIKDYGVIELELDADTAPITVTNFINLAKSGYYEGSRFHRIMKGFMMQGGIGEKEVKTIKGEFASNGIENNISHVRGVISMARADDKNSASSQFFIVHKDSILLDGNYAAFGHVTSGIEVVDKVCEESEPTDNNGTIEYDKMPIINKVTVID